MAELTVYEQLLLELVNRARLDPAGEAARLGIGLNDGLAAGSISSSVKQVLAPNELLVDSARGHSQWMIANDVFSHTGAGGSSPTTRMTAAGYVLSGSWGTGENIAWGGTTGSVDMLGYVLLLHDNLFKSAGHRLNILDADFRELGTGVVNGDFTTQGTTYHSVMATENFAVSGSGIFITGVAIADADGDNFYDIGEQRSGIAIDVSSTSGDSGADTTGAAGGYAVRIGGTSHTVTFSGGDLAAPVTVSVTPGSANAKVDLIGASEIASSMSATLGAGATALTLLGAGAIDGTGNGSNNWLYGNKAVNRLSGADGNDRLYGFAANDSLNGGNGDDVLTGGAGRDLLAGSAGADDFDINALSESGKTSSTRDRVADFTHGIDDIDLSTIDARTTSSGNQAFKFISTQAFHKVAGELHVVRTNYSGTASDKTIVEGDVNGDGRADFQIELAGLISLSSSDFIL